MGMLDKETNKDTSQITADAPDSMVGNASGSPKLDDYYVKNPGAAQTESMAPTDTAKATATGYDATTGTIDEAQTASGRLNQITSQDSANMQRAGQQGFRDAGRRGLLNSSIAAGAAQGEYVDRATPLAVKDADIFSQQNIENQRAINQAEEVSSGRQTDVSMQDAREESQTLRADTAVEGDIRMSNTRGENEIMNTVLGANANINQTALADLGAMQRTVLDIEARKYAQDSAKGAQIYASTLGAIGDLYSNPNLSEAAIKKASESLMVNAHSALNFSMGMDSLDLLGDTKVKHTGGTPNVRDAVDTMVGKAQDMISNPYNFSGGFPQPE